MMKSIEKFKQSTNKMLGKQNEKYVGHFCKFHAGSISISQPFYQDFLHFFNFESNQIFQELWIKFQIQPLRIQ